MERQARVQGVGNPGLGQGLRKMYVSSYRTPWPCLEHYAKCTSFYSYRTLWLCSVVG
jgi:hypothetical protein